MKKTSLSLRSSLAFLAASAWVPSALAEAPPQTPAESSPAALAAERPSAEGALSVELSLGDSGLQETDVLEALERELGVSVRASDAGERLVLRVEGTTLFASYGDPATRAVSREVQLPESEAAQLELIQLLSGNLVRDEASALLARLRAGPKETEMNVEPAPPEVAPPSAPDSPPPKEKELPPKRRGQMPISLTLLSPVSSDPFLKEHEAHFDVGAFYSEIGALSGLAVQGGVQKLHDGGRGLAVAGVGSHSGPFRGLNVNGFYGLVTSSEGLTVTGFYVRHKETFRGLTVSLVNSAGKAKAEKISEGPAPMSEGAMIGLVNIGGNLQGAQIGLVNVQAGKMRGAQIGLVNVSGDLSGAALGLLNFGPNVRASALAWASVNPELNAPARIAGPMGHVGVKYRIRNFYSLVGLGLGAEATGCGTEPPCRSNDVVFAPGFGAGYRFDLGPRFAVEVDGYHQVEFSPRGASNSHGATSGRVTASFKAADTVSFFIGGGPRLVVPNDDSPISVAPTFHAGIELF